MSPEQEMRRSLLAGIDHFIVVMLENRSFDHLLGALAFDKAYPSRHLVDGLRGGECNPGADGAPSSSSGARPTSSARTCAPAGRSPTARGTAVATTASSSPTARASAAR
jgi:phospholipase C